MSKNEKDANGNKVYPKDESNLIEEGEESANEINASDFEKPVDDKNAQNNNFDLLAEQQGVEANEDGEWKDIRVNIDNIINKKTSGDII